MKILCFEGGDAAGKATQTRQLKQRLEDNGLSVQTFAFPMYEHTVFGKLIRRYLNGEFGDATGIHPVLASMLYACERYETKLLLAELTCDIILLDRYLGSNLAFQGAKLAGKERSEFLDLILDIESNIFNVFLPDLTILLDTSAEVSQRLMTNRTKDGHETNMEYQESARRLYRELAANQFGSENGMEWVVVDTMSNNGIRTIEDISERIWGKVESFLKIKDVL